MKSKLQSFLILFLTLCIGIALGFLINGQVVKHRLEKNKEFFRNRKGNITQILQDTDLSEKQRDKIAPILEHHFGRMLHIHREHKEEFRIEMEALRDSLGVYLSEAQLRQLGREMRVLRRKNFRKRRNQNGPSQGP